MERKKTVSHKFADHRIFFQAHGDKIFPCNENTQRQRIIRIRFQNDRRIDNDKYKIILQLYVGTFFPVKSRLECIDRYPRQFMEFPQFLCVGSSTIQPGSLIDGIQSHFKKLVIFIMFISDKHLLPLLSRTVFLI